MTDDFSQAPQSIAELRAEREEDGTKWSPRDVLIAVLRKIDSGENVDMLVVCWRTRHENGRQSGHFFQSMQDPLASLGLLQNTIYKMQCSPGDE